MDESLNNYSEKSDYNSLKTISSIDKKSGSNLIAKRLVSEYFIKTINDRDREILIYKDGVYVSGANFLRGIMQEILQELATTHTKNDILDRIRDMTMIDRAEFSPSIKLININNGIYDLENKILLKHDPQYLFLTKIPINYSPESTCPNIVKFLNEVLSEEDIKVIQEWFGYVLYRKYFIKKAIILVGEKNTGKTTLLNLLTKFIGENNVAGVSLQKLSSDKFSAAHLYNKHIDSYDDLSFYDVNDNGSFKIATGGGYTTGEFKFGGQFQFINYAKLTFACNKIPSVKDTQDEAYFSRWIVVEFNKIIEKVNKFLTEEITSPEELSGLLNFALEGLERLLENQEFGYPKEPYEIKQQMLRSGSSVASFAYDSLEKDLNSWISKDEMYDAYISYVESQEKAALTIENFGRKLPLYAEYVASGKKKNDEGKNDTGWRNVKFKDQG